MGEAGASGSLVGLPVGRVEGVGLPMLAVREAVGGGLVGTRSWRKFRMISCVEVVGLTSVGVQVGEERLLGASGRVLLGLRSWGFLGAGGFVGCDGGELEGEVALELVGEGDLDFGLVEWALE